MDKLKGIRPKKADLIFDFQVGFILRSCKEGV